MEVFTRLQYLDMPALMLLAGILGLAVGSFLNVVIHRMPLMMQAAWDAECARYLAEKSAQNVLTDPNSAQPTPKATNDLSGVQASDEPPTPASMTLSRPRSHCPRCGHSLSWFENVPVLSWLLLRARCRSCAAPISVRYPLVELVTAAWFMWCAAQWGATGTALAYCGFGAVLLAAALIDWDTTLLPDELTLGLMWAGFMGALLGVLPVRLDDALWGAAIGYLSLWSIYWIFKIFTGREGMGYGDFKLLAALGAWLGVQGLLPIIVMSSIIGAIIGIILKIKSNLREGGYMPFGPFLAGAGMVVLIVGDHNIMQAIHRVLGI